MTAPITPSRASRDFVLVLICTNLGRQVLDATAITTHDRDRETVPYYL